MKGVVNLTLKLMWHERVTATLHRDHGVPVLKLLVVQLGKLNPNMYKGG